MAHNIIARRPVTQISKASKQVLIIVLIFFSLLNHDLATANFVPHFTPLPVPCNVSIFINCVTVPLVMKSIFICATVMIRQR